MAKKEVHALITGPIVGFIPTPNPLIPGDFTDVTEPILYYEDPQVVTAVAEAISDRHKVLGTHPDDETGAA